MTERDHDGRTVSPLALVVSVWIVVILLSLYGASTVRDEVIKSEDLSEAEALGDSVTKGMQLADAVGLSSLEGALEGVRETINAPYTILEAAPDEEPPPPPPPPDVAPPVANGGEDVVEHHRAPAKHRILVIGASSIQFAIGVELEKRIPTFEGVRVKRFGQLATGLSRPDFMDWPKKLETLASQFKPDLVITNFGGNDAQAIPIGKYEKVAFTSPEWDDKYAERVKEIIRISKKHGADTVMLGMPIMRKDSFKSKILRLNRVTEKAAVEEGALFISTFEMASLPEGGYRSTIEYGGKRGLMRTSDGVHYTRLGAKFIVEQALQIIERHYVLEGPEQDRAISRPQGFTSKILGRDVDYVAYVPRDAAADAKLGVLYVLPEPEWSTWPNHPHRALQAAAQKNGIVIVVPDLAIGEVEVFEKELLPDVERYLPVGEVRGLAAGASTATGAAAFAKAAPDALALDVQRLDATHLSKSLADAAAALRTRTPPQGN